MLLLLLSLALASAWAVERPVIGIVTQAIEWGFPSTWGRQYVAASYVKYVESAGARASVIYYDGGEAHWAAEAARVNAVLFPGGGQDLDKDERLVAAAAFFVKHSEEQARAGVSFPVLAHCQGFELVAMVGSGQSRAALMTRELRAENVSLPLSFEADAGASRWFSGMSAEQRGALERLPATINMHSWSLTPEVFRASKLGSRYRALSTSWTNSSRFAFVSTFEHREAPVFAMQFHAEKTFFVWTPEAICHSLECTRAVAYFRDFVTSVARENPNQPDEHNPNMFYNFAPVRATSFSYFEQVYFFK